MNYLIRLCSIAATFFTFEYCLKLIVCPNKKRYFTTSITIFSKLFLSFLKDKMNMLDLMAIIPFFMSSLLSGLFWNSWCENIKTISQDLKACKWSTRLATWFVWCVFSPSKWFSSLGIDQGSANSSGFQDDPTFLWTSKSDLHSPPSLERARSYLDHRQHCSPNVLKPCLRFWTKRT